VFRIVSGTRATTPQRLALQRCDEISMPPEVALTVAPVQSSPGDSSTVTKASCPS
jgi:hypothetical protein